MTITASDASPSPSVAPAPAAADAPPPPTFDVLPLTPEVRGAIDEMGWVTPTPVQIETYEKAVRGVDLIVQSRTGTGKTGAFGIPMVDRLVKPEPRAQALVLAPTRELALQSQRELTKLGARRGIRTSAVYGGAPMERQVQELREGAQIVSGTPGRVLDHLKRGTLKPDAIRMLVLDEADEMLSMGFAKELNAIVELLPRERQTLLFSATVDGEVQRIAQRHMKTPEFVTLSGDAVGAAGIAHFVYFISGKGRTRDLVRILEVEDPESAIVFCNMKSETEQVAQELQQAGFNADWLNGDLPQGEREKVMARTRSGGLRYLVATDVAARGIDISHLTHVINYTFPESTEQYIHRTGRTGRAGRTGTAISLISPQDLGGLYYLRLTYKIFPVERSIPTAGELKTRAETDRLQLLAEAHLGSRVSAEDQSLARRLLTHPDAERMIAGLLGGFFGTKGGDVDDQAAAARRTRASSPGSVAAPDLPPPPRRSAPGTVPAPERRSVAGTVGAPERRSAPGTVAAEGDEPRSRTEATVVLEPEGRPRERRERMPRDRRDRPDRRRDPRMEPSFGGAAAEPRGDTAEISAPLESSDAPGPGFDEAGMATLYLNVGRRDGVRVGEVARLVAEVGGLERSEVGKIRVRDKHTFVSVPEGRVEDVAAALTGKTLADKAIVAEPAKGAPRP